MKLESLIEESYGGLTETREFDLRTLYLYAAVRCWDGRESVKAFPDFYEPKVLNCPVQFDSDDGASKPREWRFRLTNQFNEAISNIDRKLQGRILEAFRNLSDNPLEARGDTIKPLSGKLKGCWRYRIGDYRIVYHPQLTEMEITLLDFSARSKAYG